MYMEKEYNIHRKGMYKPAPKKSRGFTMKYTLEERLDIGRKSMKVG